MYKVFFADGSEFNGGDILESQWNEMPDKSIVRLQYSLFGINLIFEGFEAYNHISEKVVFLNDPRKAAQPVPRISRIILMGKWRGSIYEVIYDFAQAKVFQRVEPYNQKYTGWKKGTFDPNCYPTIRQIKS